LGQANNAAVFGRLDIAWVRCILVERKVCPRAVIVAEVAAQTTTEVLLVEDDHVVEQLAADGANYALGEVNTPTSRERCATAGGARRLEGEAVGLRFSRRLTGATVCESFFDPSASRLLRFACT